MTRSPQTQPRGKASPGTEDETGDASGRLAFGALLRSWRSFRRYSQLDLATETEVSQRHLSFLESGRAQPSRGMILQLSEVLQVPLRERNELLLAAGFAPMYQERALDGKDMLAVRLALEATLDHHEPYPALAVDRHWDVVLQNAAADRLIALLGPPAEVWRRVDPTGGRNLMRLTLHPEGLQPLIRNRDQTAGVLLGRLQREARANPADTRLRGLLSELSALPGMPARGPGGGPDSAPPPVLTLKLGLGAVSLELFSMVCTLGTAMDVTAEELRLELFFPGDEATASFLRGNGDGAASSAAPPARRGLRR